MKLPPGVTKHMWNKVRREVVARSQVCARCGRSLVPNAKPRSPWSTSVDHRISLHSLRHADLATRRRMALDPSNLVAMHLRCNSSKGARIRRVLRTSQVW